ncbi:hypothetical protein HC028_21600 [Planosporangium flavigriseum]|uniref:Uncharacterized protein n=1 Tax=Planosporangium flavigriseum TaxID=373681 RepID=A0A8J3PMF9_9ACTN|nr:hypothetical protein [Planosporangium flavigriseum]NJC67076.1 hypothetical protein [Planosporangium flavigriseum]GIG75481.1 hypothetical protein Pfl04_38850 [Planosporangium flavigriseum]
MPIPGIGRTDRELADLDVPALLRDGLAAGGPANTELFGDGRIAAAIAADRAGVRPRSLAFLAEVVRRGGIGYAAQLPEPLPGAERTALAREWLTAATPVAGAEAVPGEEADEEFARWLEAIAVVLGVRQHAVPPR